MHELYELKNKLSKELEEYGTKEMSAGSLEIIDKLAHTVKNLGKIIKMAEEDGDYSMDYRRYPRTYQIGGSYRGGRDRMGRYSSDSMIDNAKMQISELMDSAPEQIKNDLRRVMQKLEQM